MSRQAIVAGIGIFALLVVAKPVGEMLGRQQGEASAVRAVAKAPEHDAGVEVVVTRQPADGYGENSLNNNSLASIESWVAESITEKLRRHGNPARVTTEGVLMERFGRTLAIVRVRENGGPANVALIHGFDRGDFVRVLCADRGGSQIEVTHGPCGDKLGEVFGERDTAPRS